MDDIRKIAGHALFYAIVAARSFGLFVSYTLLLVFFPVTQGLRRFNKQLVNNTQWPCSVTRVR